MKRRKLAGLALLGGAAAVTVLLVVKMTGDTFSAYLSSSIFHAAGSKGGTGSIFAAPFLVIGYTLRFLLIRKREVVLILLLVAVPALVERYSKRAIRYILPIEFLLAALLYFTTPRISRPDLTRGHFFEAVVLVLTLLMYVLAAFVIIRFLHHKQGRGSSWDPREILIVVPILEWASYSAGAAAEPLTNYYAPVALLLLLFPVLQPFRKHAIWANPTFVAIMALIAINGVAGKIITPYAWQNYRYQAMFKNREWYTHPVYGQMYIDRDLLQFSERVCQDIAAVPNEPGPELLSLPYPYPNYFCNTPPWHNYVQTFFDTAPRATVEQMMAELETAPPKWIVYQRQLNIMRGSEWLYNHGHRIAQRDLDAMIMQKLASGEWTLVDKSDYLYPQYMNIRPGDTGWYIIRTQPASNAGTVRK